MIRLIQNIILMFDLTTGSSILSATVYQRKHMLCWLQLKLKFTLHESVHNLFFRQSKTWHTFIIYNIGNDFIYEIVESNNINASNKNYVKMM